MNIVKVIKEENFSPQEGRVVSFSKLSMTISVITAEKEYIDFQFPDVKQLGEAVEFIGIMVRVTPTDITAVK